MPTAAALEPVQSPFSWMATACFPGESAFAEMAIVVEPPASSKVAVPVIWLPLFGSKLAVALVGVREQPATATATASRMKRCMLELLLPEFVSGA